MIDLFIFKTKICSDTNMPSFSCIQCLHFQNSCKENEHNWSAKHSWFYFQLILHHTGQAHRLTVLTQPHTNRPQQKKQQLRQKTGSLICQSPTFRDCRRRDTSKGAMAGRLTVSSLWHWQLTVRCSCFTSTLYSTCKHRNTSVTCCILTSCQLTVRCSCFTSTLYSTCKHRNTSGTCCILTSCQLTVRCSCFTSTLYSIYKHRNTPAPYGVRTSCQLHWINSNTVNSQYMFKTGCCHSHLHSWKLDQSSFMLVSLLHQVTSVHKHIIMSARSAVNIR